MNLELSLAVVGVGFANEDGSNRQTEALFCKPGEPVELRLEPKNKHDPRAVAVFSARGVQLGYLNADRAAYIGGKLRLGESYEAIFQAAEPTVTWIRAKLGGGSPTLPGSASTEPWPARPADHNGDANKMITRPAGDDFFPDPEPPIWGA
ncbi:MAG: hypothetical protein JWR77_2346 [Rhizorhabdus sp.]|nr:hypothetical protein [Rhizorhabdus sp.]